MRILVVDDHEEVLELLERALVRDQYRVFTGWLVFGHVPDAWAVTGMAVVAGCGAAAVWLNARESPAPHRPVPDSVVAADTLGD